MNLYLQDFKRDMKKIVSGIQLLKGQPSKTINLVPANFNLCRANGQLLISNTEKKTYNHPNRHILNLEYQGYSDLLRSF